MNVKKDECSSDDEGRGLVRGAMLPLGHRPATQGWGCNMCARHVGELKLVRDMGRVKNGLILIVKVVVSSRHAFTVSLGEASSGGAITVRSDYGALESGRAADAVRLASGSAAEPALLGGRAAEPARLPANGELSGVEGARLGAAEGRSALSCALSSSTTWAAVGLEGTGA